MNLNIKYWEVTLSILKNLTNDHRLYILNDDVLDQFKQIAASFEDQLDDAIPRNLNINVYTTVYNMWIVLQPHSPKFVYDEEKQLTHLCAFFQLEQVANYKQVKDYKQKISGHVNQIYLFAFYISVGLIQWLNTIAKQAGEIEIIEYYEDEKIFLTIEQSFNKDSFDQELLYQKILIQLMRNDIQTHPHFDQLISKAIQQTEDFYFQMYN